MAQQRVACALANGFVLGTEAFRQRQDVAWPLGQRRQRQLDGIEPVEQVFTEVALTDQCGQVCIGGADDTYADLAFAVGACLLYTSRCV